MGSGEASSPRGWPVMDVDLARWQFAFTSINHFLFVPITIAARQ